MIFGGKLKFITSTSEVTTGNRKAYTTRMYWWAPQSPLNIDVGFLEPCHAKSDDQPQF